jgi:N-acetylmuramic acid 6-phosphate (MurNAc-6-P) etherase
MADPNSVATAAAGKLLASEHADVLREAVRLMLIEITEAEVAQVAGGGRYERSGERTSYRMAIGNASETPTWARSSWPSSACAAAVTSRAP